MIRVRELGKVKREGLSVLVKVAHSERSPQWARSGAELCVVGMKIGSCGEYFENAVEYEWHLVGVTVAQGCMRCTSGRRGS
jgi:hypothetical protein